MINIEKVRTICSYLADNVDDLYITKLMKLFYYIDFISYAERDASITNDTYYKLPYGPVPSFIKSEIDNLALSSGLVDKDLKTQLIGSITLEEKQTGRMIVNISKSYDEDSLSEYEWNLVKKIAEKFKRTTAKKLTDQTHKEAPYLLTSENSEIDYNLAKQLDISKIL